VDCHTAAAEDAASRYLAAITTAFVAFVVGDGGGAFFRAACFDKYRQVVPPPSPYITNISAGVIKSLRNARRPAC